jgi:polyferredoxin
MVLRRNVIRSAFLVFFAAMMVQLWLFALWATGQRAQQVPRPDSVVGIIPVGAFMSFFAWLKSGAWDTVLPAGLVIIIAALVLSVLLKRGFCGWICPVGAFFQLPADLGKRLRRGRDLGVWRWLDLALRGLRYLVAGAAVVFLALFPVSQAIDFRSQPFYSVADIRIVRYFVHPELWWLLSGLVVVGLSLAYGNVWCRWLCPLGGLYGAVGSASISNVCRDANKCIRCGKCARACPNRVPVNSLGVVRAPECDGCQSCVQACPEPGALEPRIAGRFVMSWWMWPALALLLWLGIYAIAKLSGNWSTGVPLDYIVSALNAVGLK